MTTASLCEMMQRSNSWWKRCNSNSTQRLFGIRSWGGGKKNYSHCCHHQGQWLHSAASASACYFTLRVGVDTSDIGHSAPLPSLEINNAICWLVSSSDQLFSQLGQWFMFNISDNSCWQRSYTWHTNILGPPTRCPESMIKNHGPLFQGSRIQKYNAKCKSMKSSQYNILQYNTYPFIQIIVEFLLVDTVVIVVEF